MLNIIESTMDLAKMRGFVGMVAEIVSKGSDYVARKLKWEEVASKDFRSWSYNNKRPFEKIGSDVPSHALIFQYILDHDGFERIKGTNRTSSKL